MFLYVTRDTVQRVEVFLYPILVFLEKILNLVVAARPSLLLALARLVLKSCVAHSDFVTF